MNIFFFKLGLAVFICCLSAFAGNAQDFKNAEEAVSALNKMTECRCDTDKRAYNYFTTHPEESIPVLIGFALDNRQRHFVAVRALSKIKDERVITFLIDLVSEELHSDGKNAGSQFYDSESLIDDVINTLGDYGDARAIAIIKESSARLNNSHREPDDLALCKLGALSLDEIFELRLKSKDEMLKIASSNEYSNPNFAIKVYDWLTAKFSQEKEMVYQSHRGKIIAYLNLGNYEAVLKECDFIKVKFPERVKDLEFAVDHRGYRYEELVRFVNSKLQEKK